MGIYLCLARSSVPPIMSKRFTVKVNCKFLINFSISKHEKRILYFKIYISVKPQIQLENHYVGAPIGKEVRLHCRIEASPRATFQWINNRSKLFFNTAAYLFFWR